MCIQVFSFFVNKTLNTKTIHDIYNRIATTSVCLQYKNYINVLISYTFDLCVLKFFFCL